MALVAGDPLLEERVQRHAREHEARDDDGRDEHVEAEGVAPGVELEVGHEPEGAVEPAHVPVGLRARRDLRRCVGAEQPDRVDARHRRQQNRDAEDDEEEATGLGGVDREEPEADHVVLGAPGPGPLGVLLVPDQHQVRRDQAEDDPGDQQDVDDVQPWDEVLSGELAPEDQEGGVRAHHRDALDDAPPRCAGPVPESRSSGSE